MSDFKNKAITSKGLELLSKAITGGQLTFTRIEMGNGVQDKDPVDVERLVNVKQNLQITSINRKGSQVTLSSTLKLEDVKEEYDWTELGVYAKGDDNKEVLYLYGYTENSSFISPTSLNEKLIHVTILVSNATEVSAIIDNSLIYLSQAEMDAHNDDEAAHKPLREWVQGLFDSLKFTWGNIIGKPDVFPPSSHNHTKGEITDFPTSLPANGGDADTLDGKHDIDFVQRIDLLTAEIVNNANYNVSYMGDLADTLASQCLLPKNIWWHIIYNKHTNTNGFGMQMAFPLNSQNEKPKYRTANEMSWGEWKPLGATTAQEVGAVPTCSTYTGNIDELYAEGSYKLLAPFLGTMPRGQNKNTVQHSVLEVIGDSSPGGVTVQILHTTNHSAYSAYSNKHYIRNRFENKWSEWKEIGGENGMYLKPSATLQYATGTHAISGKYVYGGDNTYKKIGQLHLPCAGTVKVVVTTTRTGAIETGSDSFWSSITFVDNAGGSLDSSGNGTNYSVGKMKFDYANMANGTSVTDNFYDSYDGPNTYTIQSDIKTLTANQTKTETFYVTFDKGGLFTLMSTVRVSSSTNSGSATANVKADFYWEVVN